MIAMFGVIAIGAVFITTTVIIVEQRDSQVSSTGAPRPAPAASSAGQPPDLSTMTPRQAADRLYNRIMMALERGDTNEAARFAPMALQAYQAVRPPDVDAHFHIARIHLVLGDVAGVEQQVTLIRQKEPNHLFRFTLEHTLANIAGDESAMARAYAGFAEAYPSEIAKNRPEYGGHRNHLEQFRAAGRQSSQVAAAPEPPSAAATSEVGSALFVKNCASCHGVDARGTDKGPPLIHRLYEPNHHTDEAFLRAIRRGARAHHWAFGDMPPVSGVSDRDGKQIVAYVRSLQRAAGIE